MDTLADFATDKNDDFGVPVDDHLDVIRRVNNDSGNQLLERAKQTTTNWLFVMGVPTSPRELLRFADTLAQATMSGLVVDGTAILTDKAKVDDDEYERRRQAEAQKTNSLSLLDAIKNLDGMLPANATSGSNGYL